MNAKEFFDKVALMRKYQIRYFRNKRAEDLSQGRELERIVDDEIRSAKERIGERANKALEGKKSVQQGLIDGLNFLRKKYDLFSAVRNGDTKTI